ncbi:hypothetical protein [Actinacidiphila guanduensis]|uniref:hypothetical protein n=1 Tax=Actinacidiphila guanduensis TaxID=310781 RepID=UPI00159FC36F|nr:hypothetical protein [Actinacidiphila guanduensis]
MSGARAGLRVRPLGNALLVHRKGEPDPVVVAFTQALAPDPQHQLVVVDLPPGADRREWEAVPKALPGAAAGVRIVFSRAVPPQVRAFGQAAADRLGSTVLVPDGAVRTVPDGGLFVPHDAGAGWLRHRPKRAAAYDSRRFPKPAWEYAVADRPWSTAPHAVVEPTASGIWLRGHAPGSAGGRHWLVDRIAGSVEVLTAVLGSPGGPPVELPDAVRVWHSVLPSARPWVRFLQLGPVTLPEGVESLGQGLADSTGEQVVFYTGLPALPLVAEQARYVEVPNRDGTAAWRPFAGEVVYYPSAGAVPPAPTLLGVRSPVTGAAEETGRVFAYGHGTVLEVVQSGLWLRPPAEPVGGDAVRRVTAAPGRAVILYDRSTPETGELLRGLAEDMLRQLDPTLRDAFRVAPADAPGAALGWSVQEWWSATPAMEPPAAHGHLREERAAAHHSAAGRQDPGPAAAHHPAAAPTHTGPHASRLPQQQAPSTETQGPPAERSPYARPIEAPPLTANGTEYAPAAPQQATSAGPAGTAPQPPAGPASPQPPHPGAQGQPHGHVPPPGHPEGPPPAYPPAHLPAQPQDHPGGGDPRPGPPEGQPPQAGGGGPSSPPPPTPPDTPPHPEGPPPPQGPATAPDSAPPPAPPQAAESGMSGPSPARLPRLTETAAPFDPVTPNTPVQAPPSPPGPPPATPPRPAPANPVSPAGPTSPATPPSPATPDARVTPAAPGTPASPANPITPAGPDARQAPPSPVDPPIPGARVTPQTPASPAAPDASGTPRNPIAPQIPGTRQNAGTLQAEGAGHGTPVPNAPGPAPTSPAPATPAAVPPPPTGQPTPSTPPTPVPRTGDAPPPRPPAPALPIGIRLESSGTPAPTAPAAPAGGAPQAGGGPGDATPARSQGAPAAQGTPGTGRVPTVPGTPQVQGTAPQAAPGTPQDPANRPSEAAGQGVRVQPVPPGGATAVPPERGLEKERAWLRKTFSSQFGALAGSVSRVMSESPGLRSGSREEGADTLTDLVAVRLYLGGDHDQVDAAVRRANPGPHVPLARCVTAGLRRLPSYRGAALLHAPVTAQELGWYREGRVATEWAFCRAWSAPYRVPGDDVLFLVWSMTARRTRLLDPAQPDRVLFEPGTRFRVLRTDPGTPAAVLLRELSPSEPDEPAPAAAGDEDRAASRSAALDALALVGLEKTLTALRGAKPEGEPPPPGTPPGLLPPYAAAPTRPPKGRPGAGTAKGPQARRPGAPGAPGAPATTSSTSNSTSSSKGARR